MRLLHFDHSGRLISTNFHGKSIPPYAILSHRWQESEISFEDIARGSYKERKEGYQKLQFCAKQAALDALQYFWIDTCCIDKWNLLELSKAINSMFQWYKNAARCYVFLSDVSVPTATGPVQRSDWEASFRASDWFTRGWTLQELIAPASVAFFSREGQFIGDKSSLGQLIHDITSLPLAALHYSHLNDFSTSERIRWSANRKTSLEEDIVYCLLGVLGVSMPATYGEGKEKARSRLQAELEAAGSSAPSIIPFSRNEHFVGRESQLDALETKLFSNEQSTTTLAIVGPGGTGKSQLALEFAHRTRLKYKGCSVFWIDAGDKDSLHQSLTSVSQKLGILGSEAEQADRKQLVRHCVAELSKRQCLLVFDNAEDTFPGSSSSSTAEAAQFEDHLPQSTFCSILFTTTNSGTAEALPSENVIVLQELSLETAQKLLQNRLSRPSSDTEQQQLRDLLTELSYLPLAVVQAAACMNESGMTLQEYQAQLYEHKQTASEYNSNSAQVTLPGSSVEDLIEATLFVSIRQVRCTNSVAADYLFFAACVDRKDISLDLLDAPSAQAREDAITVLDKYALIARRHAESALDIHRLVHDALRKLLQAQGRLRFWTDRAVAQLHQLFPIVNDNRNRSKWRRLLPHAQYALLHSRTDDNNAQKEKEEEREEQQSGLAWVCSLALSRDGRYKETEELQLQVVQMRKRVLGDEHTRTLYSISGLAETYIRQGRWHEAEELQVQVIPIMKREFGDEDEDTLRGLSRLSQIYMHQGRWDDAEKIGVQVIQIRKRVLGDEHPDTLLVIGNLPLIYCNQGRYEEAVELGVQMVRLKKRVLGDEDSSTLISMSYLATTYMDQGQWKEAEDLQVQVLETFKRALGDDHPDTLVSMHNLAFTLYSQAHHKEATTLMEECLQSRRRILGEHHPDTQMSLRELHTWRAE